MVSAIEQTRVDDFRDCHEEFNASCEYLANSIEASKRKLLNLGIITDEQWLKRYKQIERDRKHLDKENINSNVEPSHKTIKAISKHVNEPIIEEDEDEEDLDKEIDVASLKVSELRLHLKERGLDQFGLKKDLQKRLQDAIDEEKEEDLNDDSQDRKSEIGGSNSEVSDTRMSDVPMTDVSSGTAKESQIMENNINSAQESSVKLTEEKKFVINAEDLPDVDDGSVESIVESDIEDLNDDDPVMEEQPSAIEPASQQTNKGLGHYLAKAASKIFSPGTSKKSPQKMDPMKDMCHAHVAVEPSPTKAKVTKSPPSNSSNSSTSPNRKRMSMVCDMSLTEIKSEKESNENKISCNEQNSTRVSSNESTKSASSVQIKIAGGTNSISKSNAEKMEAIREARAARLQQIRNKVNQIPVSSSVKSAVSASSILKSKLKSSAANPEEERKRAIAEKMRQKALTVQSAVKPTQPAITKPVVVSTPVEIKKQEGNSQKDTKKVLSPMDTYQMSDREESESEESESEEQTNRKPIAVWAQRQNLLPALQEQFLDGPKKMDPDKIFHDIFTCDLEAIFGKKKSKYQDRRSTGNWTKDKVTLQERDAYSRQMGFK